MSSPSARTVPAVDVTVAHDRADGTVLVDVREPFEFDQGHAPGAVLHPLGGLDPAALPEGDRYYVICRSGNRSAHATAALVAAGLDAHNVDGGMIAWSNAGLPVDQDPPPPPTPRPPAGASTMSGTTIDLTAESFPETVSREGIVLVDWWAAWCGPCRSFAPTFEAAAKEHTDITFAKVDTEAEQELAGAAGIQSIPTLMAFRDGILVFGQPGALPAAALEDLIRQVRELDMDDIRAQIAAQAEQG